MRDRSFLLHTWSCLTAAIVWLFLSSSPAIAQTVPVIAFDADIDFLRLPKDLYLGEVTGVAVDSKHHVFVFSRGNTSGPAYAAAAAQLLEFGPDGTFIREIGKNLYAWSFAHVVRVDRDDNIWAVDKGSDMIIKFNPQGRVEYLRGRSLQPSDPGLRRRRQAAARHYHRCAV